jgi:hypothetical protein
MRITIEFNGLTENIEYLTAINEKAIAGIEKQTALLARDSQSAWRGATPKRSGRLQSGDVAQVDGMSFTLGNAVYYYDFVDLGHNTPAGWRTKHGYRPAKRRSHVAGREITQKAVQFIEENAVGYISKFLDDI